MKSSLKLSHETNRLSCKSNIFVMRPYNVSKNVYRAIIQGWQRQKMKTRKLTTSAFSLLPVVCECVAVFIWKIKYVQLYSLYNLVQWYIEQR